MPFVVAILVSLAVSALSFLLMPKPKMPKAEVQDFQGPQASGGMPIQVVFGTKIIKNPNCLWYGKVGHTIQKVKM